MHGWETRMLLKHCLERAFRRPSCRGGSASAGGRSTPGSRPGAGPGSGGRGDAVLAAPRRPHKLDPYKGIIDERLGEYPRLTAQRLFDEVRAAGYEGGYSRVRDYVHEVRPREPAEPAVRFETPPGRQGQVDFGTFTLPWGRRHVLVVVLGHSRLLWLRFYPRQTMDVLIDGLESAFERFGGVPRELLFDQMRAVVLSDDRSAGGELVLNAEFLRFSAHWGFVARSCRAYRAQTKGKVERPIRYLRESFFYGRESSTTPISTSRRRAGSRARPTSACTAPRESGRWTASSATNAPPCVPWRNSPTAASAPPRLPRRRGRVRRSPWTWRSGRCGSTPRRPGDAGRGQPARPGAGDARRPEDARRPGGGGRHPGPRRRRRRDRHRGHRGAARRRRSRCATTAAWTPPCARRGCRR